MGKLFTHPHFWAIFFKQSSLLHTTMVDYAGIECLSELLTKNQPEVSSFFVKLAIRLALIDVLLQEAVEVPSITPASFGSSAPGMTLCFTH